MKKWLVFFPLFVFLLNLILKFLYLTTQEIAHDEPFSIYHAQFGIDTLIDQLKGYNNPPLFEMILHYWIKLFGISPLSVRMLPLLFGALGPVALYYFVRKHFSVTIAIVSSLLLSFSTLLVYYSHDCRVYSLFMLLSILSMHFYLEVVNCKSRCTSGILYVLFSSLLIYSHYFGIILLLIQFLHLVFFSRPLFFRFLMYWTCILIIYIPHILVMIERLGYSVTHGTWLESPVGVESLYNMIWSFSNEPVVAVACIILLVFGLVSGILRKPVSESLSMRALVLFWFVIPFFGMFVVSYKVPMYISRYLIFALPGYYILLGLCIESLIKTDRFRNIALVFLVLSFAFTLNLNPDKKQYIREAIDVLKKRKTDSTIVLVTPYDLLPSFSYNYNRDYFSSVSDNKEYYLIESLLKKEGIHLINNSNDLIGLEMSRYNRVIYLRAESETLSTSDIRKKLNEQFLMRGDVKIGEYYQLYEYKKTAN